VIAALSSEWLKIRTTRTIFWLLFALAGLVTLIVVSSILAGDKASLVKPSNQLDLLGIGILAVMIALIMGLIVSTGEFRHGTITPTLLSTPSRPLVVISKAVAAVLLGVTLVAFAELLVIAEMAALLPLRGIDLVLDGGDAARLLVRILAASAIWAGIGSGLGLAFKNQIGTFVGCFAWLFIAEGLVNAILNSHWINSHAGRFLPLSSTGSMLNDNATNVREHMLSQWGGVTALSGWMLLATILALVLLSRRDVS
jgi:ABC-2 type transport system permease protein